jgi:hypothetical protein
MPRKAKQPTKDVVVEETPVVFTLRITEDVQDAAIEPVGETAMTDYSEILNSVEISKQTNSFNTELLKSVLDKIVADRYSAHTCCFWCCHKFHWTPVYSPISYDAYKNMYTCEGHFCSPECALAYIYNDNRHSDSTKWNRHSLLRFLYSELYKERTLSPAPPKTLLRMFGGPLDIEQYREYTMNDNHIVLSELYPVRLLFPSMNVQAPLRDIRKYVSLSTDVVEKASEQLRLKRSKPVNVNIPTLDKCIIGNNR